MIVTELQYFPPITFFVTLYKESYIYIDLYENYRKMSFRNRCLVTGAQGIISLSVPLRDGRNQQLPMNEVLIADSEKWQERHFRSIESAYNRSPFFDHYRDELAELFRRPSKHLSEWNLECMTWLKEKLGWPAEIRFTDSAVEFGRDGMDDRRDKVLPKNYNRYQPLRYRQVFEERTGFFSNLSILDLLFNTGKTASEMLKKAGG
jgi:hypothetical protein